jgi:hypothetical protein
MTAEDAVAASAAVPSSVLECLFMRRIARLINQS